MANMIVTGRLEVEQNARLSLTDVTFQGGAACLSADYHDPVDLIRTIAPHCPDEDCGDIEHCEEVRRRLLS